MQTGVCPGLEETQMMLIWIALTVAVVVLDMVTSNILYSWMGLGFLGAIVAESLGWGIPAQVVTACLIGAVSFVTGSYVSRKYLRKNIDQTPILTDKIIGTVHTATIQIGEETQYKVNGIYWLLRNEGPIIMPGDQFRIVGIKNNRLYVVKEI